MMEKIKFIVRTHREKLQAKHRSVVVLTIDNWNDFGFNVQFQVAYIDSAGLETRIGEVKILQRTSDSSEPITVADKTKLAGAFSELGDNYISLGQDDDYYKDFAKLLGDRASDVLVALRDIAWRPALATEFEPTSAFRNAMVRANGANRSRRFGRAWVLGEPITEKLSFSYSCKIEGAELPIDVDINFDDKDPLPGRVVGVIGRNAVGKTRFLARLGEDLAQISRTSAERIAERDSRFPDGRPLFTRIIAISYSAFDHFKRPDNDVSSSYVYCGIRNDRGGFSRKSLIEAYRKNQSRIRDRGLQAEWMMYMGTILGDLSEGLKSQLAAEISDPAKDDQTLSFLSSGQSILCHFATALLAWIQPNSLVLFDEPETHLHPNAVASLFLVLADILKAYDSFAIVATHSPLVIQEIPAKRVIVFQRVGNVTSADPLPLESLGESVTELTRHVFETIEVESLYRRTFRALAKKESPEEVLARFDRGLSLSAQAYLLAQYGNAKGKKA